MSGLGVNTQSTNIDPRGILTILQYNVYRLRTTTCVEHVQFSRRLTIDRRLQ